MDEAFNSVPGRAEVVRRQGTNVIVQKTAQVYRASADDGCVANDELATVWRYGASVEAATSDSSSHALGLIIGSGWPMWLLVQSYICGLALAVLTVISYIYAGNASTANYSVYTPTLDASGNPDPAAFWTVPLPYIVPVGYILALISLLVTYIRGQIGIANDIYAHANVYTVWAVLAATSIFQVIAISLFVNAAYLVFFLLAPISNLFVVWCYIDIDEEVSKFHDVSPASFSSFLKATVVNVAQWVSLILFYLIADANMPGYQIALFWLYVVFGVIQWLLVLVYLYGNSINDMLLTNYPLYMFLLKAANCINIVVFGLVYFFYGLL